ncbi:hypothetical protein QBC37DRAFT_378252 [Rhypophila decipiens]|uniref:Uncharacterized protein n=1 Tax=Rhypophila decipiens TaxID=261697 RepID=A0AAN6XYH6_9PEZI|nr:hypothetical protein QBC37DRAFT_378252 [Rhypophila decipiens]
MEIPATLETGTGLILSSAATSFWVILVLGITSAWHPPGSSIGFPDEIRRYVRIFPLTALFDTVILWAEFVIHIFDAKYGSSSTNPDDSERRNRALSTNKVWLQALILFIGLAVRARLLRDILAILSYTKMYGYYGTPVSFTFATLYFPSWLANEMFSLLAYGIFLGRQRTRTYG